MTFTGKIRDWLKRRFVASFDRKGHPAGPTVKPIEEIKEEVSTIADEVFMNRPRGLSVTWNAEQVKPKNRTKRPHRRKPNRMTNHKEEA